MELLIFQKIQLKYNPWCGNYVKLVIYVFSTIFCPQFSGLCMCFGSNGLYIMVLILGIDDCVNFEPCTVYNRRHTAEKRNSKGKEIAEPLSCYFETRMPNLRWFLLISLCVCCWFGTWSLDNYQSLMTLQKAKDT